MKSLILSPFRLDWPSKLKTGDEASCRHVPKSLLLQLAA